MLVKCVCSPGTSTTEGNGGRMAYGEPSSVYNTALKPRRRNWFVTEPLKISVAAMRLKSR